MIHEHCHSSQEESNALIMTRNWNISSSSVSSALLLQNNGSIHDQSMVAVIQYSRPDWEQLLVGLLYVLLGTVFITLNGLCTAAIYRGYRDMQPNTPYIFMAVITICTSIELFVLCVVGGIITLICRSTNQNAAGPALELLEKITGAVAYGFSESEVAFTNILAFNRFVALMSETWCGLLFESRRRLIFWLLLGSGYGAAFLIGLLLPDSDMTYDLQTYSWYTLRSNTTRFIDDVAVEVDIGQNICFYVWYTGVAVKIVLLRLGITHHWPSKADCIALFQAFLICLNITFLMLMWHYLPPTSLNTFISNLLWIYNSAAAAFIYLACNGTIRKQVLQLIRGRSSVVEPSPALHFDHAPRHNI